MKALISQRVRMMAVAFAAAGVLILAPPTRAAHTEEEVNPTDFDTLDLGTQVAADLTTDIETRKGQDIGDLTGSVFFNSSSNVYTYVLELAPGINNISEFNTGFDVAGFNGVVGWSFSQATEASGGKNGAKAFEIDHEDDGTLDWGSRLRQRRSRFFDAGEVITFFFQSTLAPGELDEYNMINHRAGGTDNYAPGEGPTPAPVIPTPAAFPAGVALLSAFALARKRRWQVV